MTALVQPDLFDARTVVLSFGGGVDSSAILLWHLFHEPLGIRHVVFADTGAEHPETYANVERFRLLCEEHGLPFHTVAKPGETITEWCLRLGIVPVLAGGSHICSKKFKGDVIAKWAQDQGIDWPVYLIGIEANEGYRCSRFTTPKGDRAEYQYPLVELGMTRSDCEALIKRHGMTVRKSSCIFCPFMSQPEIIDAMNDPHSAPVIRLVEQRFMESSREKHQAWLDAGQPVDSAGRALRGMWKRDSWQDGRRLFVKSVGGKCLSVSEWGKISEKRMVTHGQV